MAYDERNSGAYGRPEDGTGEKPTRSIDYKDPVSVIEAILDEMDCTNPFTRSNVYIVANRVLADQKKTLQEVVMCLRFDGVEDFCSKYGDQEEIPTTPSTPSSRSSSGLLLSNLREMSAKVAAAFNEGAAATPGLLDDQSSAPSSHRFPKRKP